MACWTFTRVVKASHDLVEDKEDPVGLRQVAATVGQKPMVGIAVADPPPPPRPLVQDNRGDLRPWRHQSLPEVLATVDR